jgi:hypothetical protein
MPETAAAPVPGIDFAFTKWDIANLERHVNDGVVYTVHYTVSHFEDGEQAGAYGSIGLEAPEPGKLIPYADLTAEIVVGWVKNYFGDEKVAEIEAALSAQVQEKLHPTSASGVPWNAA